jgi:predicted nucleic acid-binding protein
MRNMANKLKVLFDLNVILDVLQERQPFFSTSASLLACVETGTIEGYLAAHSIATLFYLIQKDKSAAQARASITNLMQFMKIAPVDQTTVEQALNLDYRDFEDALQMISAVQCKVDYLVTRNKKDFQPALLPVAQPSDVLSVLSEDDR